jgi:spore coat polysaccharide biosynthesis protein SpsF
MKTAIVICSRIGSSRIPGKALREIEGKPIIAHLVDRLRALDLPIIIAVPRDEVPQYEFLVVKNKIYLYGGEGDDPLVRTALVARKYKLDTVIRVTHDKVFVDIDSINQMLEFYEEHEVDYVSLAGAIAGTGAEIISARAIIDAAEKFKGVEFISYAIKAVVEKSRCHSFKIADPTRGALRLLIDYPNDLSLVSLLMSKMGADCSLASAVHCWQNMPWISEINKLPKVSVYTSAFNAEKFLSQAMASVKDQKMFSDLEYILVDDFSSDDTPELMAKFCVENSNARWVRNNKNLGLAASSNVALSIARAPYILRLDADDFFTNKKSVEYLYLNIHNSIFDAVVPNNYFGSFDKIQKGKDGMHIGGTIFKTAAVNHIKFNDKLRNYDGLDFFTRGRMELTIGYLKKPMFFYTQRADSMSHTNLAERARMREEIESIHDL